MKSIRQAASRMSTMMQAATLPQYTSSTAPRAPITPPPNTEERPFWYKSLMAPTKPCPSRSGPLNTTRVPHRARQRAKARTTLSAMVWRRATRAAQYKTRMPRR